MTDLRKILEKEMEKSGGAAKLVKREYNMTEKDLETIKRDEKTLNAVLKANQAMRLRSFEKASNQFLK
ncbi:unknown [Clostridium sp. CAG:356]|jgi:hypothetical protein|nr:unknown [Clostridium sp. CAG:356]